jgi:hypothetical protein
MGVKQHVGREKVRQMSGRQTRNQANNLTSRATPETFQRGEDDLWRHKRTNSPSTFVAGVAPVAG